MALLQLATVTRTEKGWTVESLAGAPGSRVEVPNGWVRELGPGAGDAALGVSVVDALGESEDDPDLVAKGEGGVPPTAPGSRRVLVENDGSAIMVMPMAQTPDGAFVHDTDVAAAEVLLTETGEVLGAAVRAVIEGCRSAVAG